MIIEIKAPISRGRGVDLQVRPPNGVTQASQGHNGAMMFAAETSSLSVAELAERWRSVLADPTLDDLPEGYRVELDQFGDLIVSPRPTNRHQVLAALVCDQLRDALKGFATAGELSITTQIGVRVPDGFWSADATRWAMDGPAAHAPEICVEVASPSNSSAWLARKAQAFIAAGAQEVVVVAVDGASARYFHSDGAHESSRFVQLRFPLLGADG